MAQLKPLNLPKLLLFSVLMLSSYQWALDLSTIPYSPAKDFGCPKFLRLFSY
jgi:hypothetical protein